MTKIMTRKIPIDFEDISHQTGLIQGKVCKTIFGWGVQNHSGSGPSVALIDPPQMQPEESDLRIEDNHWCFYTDLVGHQKETHQR